MKRYFPAAEMRRHENQAARPTAGCLSVPLFNQKKRNRLPLTSTPLENEFFYHNEYMPTNSASSGNTAGTSGCYQASGPSTSASAPQSHQWNRQGGTLSYQPQQSHQQYGGSRPAPGPAPTVRDYTHLPHPYKLGNTSSQMGKPNNTMRQQDSRSNVNSGQNTYQAFCNSGGTQSKPHSGFSQMGQQSAYRQANPPKQQYSQQSRPLPPRLPPPSRPSLPAAQPQNTTWKIQCTKNSRPQTNRSTFLAQTQTQAQQTQPSYQVKPAIENSLRIVTTVVDGIRHWSQFKDRVPYLFEIFATLDSAVTLGAHRAKNFLMRDGKEVVQCVFYENEQELPRLIRGQVHRCVGNYDRNQDILVCVSVRPGLPSEQRNAQEAVKACDVEMRALVKSVSEV
ncbi:spermatogenesis-associated protein 22 [Myripristis murdjan]|uniref:spermatogenesis-associated protein 22 n=1 Tax=Myripristis murdjan TaxID=586833 RepID=UPI00117609B2|nr:spermatogenesis-associated protein 22 [Myripristis murdjan]